MLFLYNIFKSLNVFLWRPTKSVVESKYFSCTLNVTAVEQTRNRFHSKSISIALHTTRYLGVVLNFICACFPAIGQEWKERGLPAWIVLRLTEIHTGDLLLPVSTQTNCASERFLLFPLLVVITSIPQLAGADKKAEAGAGAATEFQFVSINLISY